MNITWREPFFASEFPNALKKLVLAKFDEVRGAVAPVVEQQVVPAVLREVDKSSALSLTALFARAKIVVFIPKGKNIIDVKLAERAGEGEVTLLLDRPDLTQDAPVTLSIQDHKGELTKIQALADELGRELSSNPNPLFVVTRGLVREPD